MSYKRKVQDSHGNWAQVILFSELNIPDSIKYPTPEAIAFKFFERIPDIGFGRTDRINEEDQERIKDYLMVAFTLMTPKQQIVIYRRFYQNKTLLQIAKEVGISVPAVFSLEKNALKTLSRIILGKNFKLKKRSNKKGEKLGKPKNG